MYLTAITVTILMELSPLCVSLMSKILPTSSSTAEANNLGFIQYSAWMALPGATGGLVCTWLLCMYFRKSIPARLPKPEGTVNAADAVASRGKDTPIVFALHVRNLRREKGSYIRTCICL